MKSTLIALTLATLVLPLHAAEGDGAEKKRKVDPEKVFNRKDADGDDSLSKEEFVKGAKDAAKASTVFDKKDKNSDGKLSLEEFKAVAAKKKKKP